jgi:hypothetical protein
LGCPGIEQSTAYRSKSRASPTYDIIEERREGVVMESPSSNSSVETQFRQGFLGLLETLRFSVVSLHNELGRQAPEIKTPAKDGEPNPDALELVDGKNNFITRIEKLKHDVAYHPGIHLKVMRTMILEFESLKTDLINELQNKIASQRTNPSAFFSNRKNEALSKSIEQISQNWIKIEDNKLKIHTASIPEEVYANKLSSGTPAKRF